VIQVLLAKVHRVYGIWEGLPRSSRISIEDLELVIVQGREEECVDYSVGRRRVIIHLRHAEEDEASVTIETSVVVLLMMVLSRSI
jgi:hypothetical protein